MNLVETYVSNITRTIEIPFEYGTFYELLADTNCYGQKKVQTKVFVSKGEYDSIMSKGYYLT